MIPFLDNKLVRYGLFGLGAIVALFVAWVALNLLSSAAGFSSADYAKVSTLAPGYDGAYMDEVAMDASYAQSAPAMGRAMLVEGDMEIAQDIAYYPEQPVLPPVPQPDGYTSGLERYETTSYNLSARSRDFDALCDTLTQVKADSDIHFKSLNTSLNYCNAQFFVEEDRVPGVLAMFESYRNVEVNRNTQSVTRHKEQIEGRTSIVTQQLASVERTLAEAEVAYDEIVAFARANRDAATLSESIREKLQQIDYLTQRKINLTSQLDNLAQQAVDLQERLNVVEFYASFNRVNPINIGENHWRWAHAWNQLTDRFNDTLVGLTTQFGVFLLYVLQYGLYLLALIAVARLGWKVVRRIWKM